MKPQNQNKEIGKEIGVYKEHFLLDNVFVKDTDLQFIFKKTEKIITAIYLITNFLVLEEPLKWSLRNSATGLLKTLMSFSQSALADREKSSHALSVGILELTSFFDLAYHSGFVSQMNYDILNFEISRLTASIAEYNSESISSNKSLFDQDYFYVRKIEKDTEDIKDTNAQEFYKGQTLGHYKGQNSILKQNVFYNSLKDSSDNNTNLNKGQFIKDTYQSATSKISTGTTNETNTAKDSRPKNKKTNQERLERRQLIIAEVKKQGEVSVKDIAKVVTDVGEKTLQRELLAMVDDGLLKKKGERRWSRYTI